MKNKLSYKKVRSYRGDLIVEDITEYQIKEMLYIELYLLFQYVELFVFLIIIPYLTYYIINNIVVPYSPLN